MSPMARQPPTRQPPTDGISHAPLKANGSCTGPVNLVFTRATVSIFTDEETTADEAAANKEAADNAPTPIIQLLLSYYAATTQLLHSYYKATIQLLYSYYTAII